MKFRSSRQTLSGPQAVSSPGYYHAELVQLVNLICQGNAACIQPRKHRTALGKDKSERMWRAKYLVSFDKPSRA